MPLPVKLNDLLDAFESASDERSAWLDRQTGRVIVVDQEVMNAVEESSEDATPAALEDWQEEQVPVARGILNDDPRYLALPDKFEFHEYRHMEQFIGTVQDESQADQLWRAIKGRGAFRYFKDTAHRLGLIDAWYRHRDDALNRCMTDWAEANDVAVDASPGRTGLI